MIISVAGSVRELIRLDAPGVIFAVSLSALCIYGLATNFDFFGYGQMLFGVLLIGACAKLMFIARAQFSKSNVPWTEACIARERSLVFAAGLVFLMVCWIASLVFTQTAALTGTSLVELLALTGAIAVIVGVTAVLRSRTAW